MPKPGDEDRLESMFQAIRDAKGSLTQVAELVYATRCYCQTLDEYDRKSNPFNLRRMTAARERMREVYRCNGHTC